MNRFHIACIAAVLSGGTVMAVAPAMATGELALREAPPVEENGAVAGDNPIPMPRAPESMSADPSPDVDAAVPEILSDTGALPEPVRRMRELILDACRRGDLEGLRRLIGSGDAATQLSFGVPDIDPIDFLREISGDGEGHEILAILAEVLEADFVRMDAGTPHELYVWPYFYAYPLDQLAAPQRVELFRLVTAGDYEDMLAFGGYNFYRVGISPAGEWVFFVAGD